MFLADYHTHTTFSPDAKDSMLDMARAAAERGVAEICFTNHVESCSDDRFVPHQFPPFDRWDEMRNEFNETKRALEGVITPVLGIELGCPHHDPELAKSICANPDLDFIIGSIHNLRGTNDFYYMDYESEAETRDLTERYFQEYIELANTGFFDVLGHLGYMQRYMARKGKFFDIMDFEDIIRELFRLVIGMGKGIEVNTSALHDALGRLIPDTPVLALYKECGGEIITVGSDSHNTQFAGYGIADTYEVLRTLGFKYVTTFRAHKPEFIKL